MPLQRITQNLKPTYREDKLLGRDFLVVPMVMMTEGVHNGSDGAIYYPPADLEDAMPAWNHKPILLDHPTTRQSGTHPDVLNSQAIGVVLNGVWDGKQKAEAWLEKSRLELLAKDVLENVLNGIQMEVSTGLYVSKDPTAGVWNKEAYEGIAKNHKPDHLAILSNGEGACSIKDGAGLLVNNMAKVSSDAFKQIRKLLENELSHNNIWNAIYTWLKDKFKPVLADYWDGWLEDIFETFFIYSEGDGKLWKLGYTVSKDTVTVSDDSPVEVKRVTEYRTTAGSLVGNAAETLLKEKLQMPTKKELVDGIIANKATKWEEKDREALMALNEEMLAKFDPIENKKEEEKKPVTPPVDNKKEDEKPKPAATFEELVANADPAYRPMLNDMKGSYLAEKASLIKTIVDNKRNKFPADYLDKQDNATLRNLAALAAPEQEAQSQAPSFFGAYVPPITSNSGEKAEESLVLPVMNFGSDEESDDEDGKKKKKDKAA